MSGLLTKIAITSTATRTSNIKPSTTIASLSLAGVRSIQRREEASSQTSPAGSAGRSERSGGPPGLLRCVPVHASITKPVLLVVRLRQRLRAVAASAERLRRAIDVPTFSSLGSDFY